MRLVVSTAAGGGPFDGVFWSSYLDAGGPRPEAILFLENSRERGVLRKLGESFLLFRPSETSRLTSARKFGHPLTDIDRERGLHLDFTDLFESDSLIQLESLNSESGMTTLQELAPEVIVSVGSPEIFEDRVLEIPKRGALNVHNGRLPDYRGMFGTFWELYNGEQRGWVTVHEMTPEVDAGDIVSEEAVPLKGGMFEALVTKKELGGRLLARLLSGDLPSRLKSQAARESAAGYYSWPSLRDMWQLRFGGAP